MRRAANCKPTHAHRTPLNPKILPFIVDTARQLAAKPAIKANIMVPLQQY